MKKKQDVVIKVTSVEQFTKLASQDYTKIVVANIHDKFWGPCEVTESMIKRFLDENDCITKVDFVSVDRDLTGDLFNSFQFNSKPKFFVIHRGNIKFYVDGLDFPTICDEIKKCLIEVN